MEEDLFDLSVKQSLESQPLAYRMRPRTLDEYIGQEHIVGPGRLLRRAIQADQLSSVIFYGPPGTGKTTLARVIANTTKSHFSTINAVLAGVKEIRYEIDSAQDRLKHFGKRTILFVDEVHRWNKSQQDALLPWVENGTFILIGATTENPYFEVNAALVSRSRIFQLKSLTSEDLTRVAMQALKDPERGYGKLEVSFEEGALEHLVDVANGDARSLLNALELAVETGERKANKVFISKTAAEESIQRKVVLYDKEGDYHFDVISAFIKSIRGSDPDAALYWLCKMVVAGEDPKFIFRRMMISACEDIGMADPNAIVVVNADAQAFAQIGLPEGRFHLTHAALYLSTAPKSNSALCFFDIIDNIQKESTEVPNHLRDASRDQKGFGHGEGYLYPHAYRDHWVAQQYLPDTLQGRVFYKPGRIGYEAGIADAVERRREVQLEAGYGSATAENLTFSPGDRERSAWVTRAQGQASQMLEDMRKSLYDSVKIIRSDRVLVYNPGNGYLFWEAYRRTPEGYACAVVQSKQQYDYILKYCESLEDVQKFGLYMSLEEIPKDLDFEVTISSSPCSSPLEDHAILDSLTCSRSFAIAQVIPNLSSRLSDFIEDPGLKALLLEAESSIYQAPRLNWTVDDLIGFIKPRTEHRIQEYVTMRQATRADLARWLEKSYLPACPGLEQSREDLARAIVGPTLKWKTKVAFIWSA